MIELKCLGKISPSSTLSDRQKEILKGLENSENDGLSRTPLARENAFLNGNQCASKILLSKESQAQYSKDYFDFFLSM
ncbi:hypothetical protein FAI41_00625 [Acetobacteraceae bacterium]|nr:hypothetical protein FAI41_00625 [Acetobacteraceae bacterium]